MSGRLFDKYGAILNEDVEVLEGCLTESMRSTDVFRVLEIGMHDGTTARGIERFLHNCGLSLEYYGIDPDPGTSRPRYTPAGGKVIVGDSCEVFNQVPDSLDLVWVDGCHCFNHIVLDVLHYAPKVKAGGFMCFHDINPAGQGQEHQYHGPVIPEFGLAVVAALNAVKFPWGGWQLFASKTPPEVHNCGTAAYRKIG